MARKGGLGRGFGDLVESGVKDKSLAEVLGQANRRDSILEVDLTQVKPDPNQPRKSFDDKSIAELSSSIDQHGILQPIIALRDGEEFLIVSGERRWRAAKKSGLKTVPVIVRSMNDQQKLEVGLVENLQREDLSLLDTAIALKALEDDFQLSKAEIALRVGKSKAAVANLIRLTSLGGKAREMIGTGELSEGHARQLIDLDESTQEQIIQRIQIEGWTIRQTEAFVRTLKNGTSDTSAKVDKSKALVSTRSTNDLTVKLEKSLKMPVKVEPMAKGGKIVIRYKTDADLGRLKKFADL